MLRRNNRRYKKKIIREASPLGEGIEEPSEKACMKYYYKNRDEFERLNLPCRDRGWLGGIDGFNDVGEYRPSSMNEYINRYFSDENKDFGGESPFAYQRSEMEKDVEEICSREEFKLKPHQKFSGMFMNNHTDFNGILLYHSLGSGKCHAVDTPILMYDGSIKKVQNIKIGDQIMGDDSTPRNVLTLGRGRDIMYDVIPVKGDTYTYNSEHILCLKCSNWGYCYFKDKRIKNQRKFWRVNYLNYDTLTKNSKAFETELEAKIYLNKIKKNNKIIHITISDYLKLSKSTREQLKMYRTGIDFKALEIPFDAYIIGLWIGDGDKRGPVITNQDSVVIKYLKETLPKYNMYLSFHSGYTYRMCSTIVGNNILSNVLKSLNLKDNKHIPDIYKINSRQIRLEVLAGLIDTDGHYDETYEIVQKDENITDDIIYLSRSLGFAAYKHINKTSWTHKGIKKYGKAFRITISGYIDEIPVKIYRKKAKERKQKKNVLVTGFKVIEKPEDNYYGFTLDNNHRFLLGDFTVSHNTCTSLVIGEAMKSRGIDSVGNYVNLGGRSPYKVFIVAPKNIQEQYYEEIIGRVRDNTIQSCTAGCVIMEGEDGEENRQIYVGNTNPQTGLYNAGILNRINNLEYEIAKTKKNLLEEKDREDRSRLRKKIKKFENDLSNTLESIKNKISAIYYVISHTKFLNMVMKTVNINNVSLSEPTNFLLTNDVFHTKNSLIIIDEVQKLVSEFSDESGSNYRKLYYTLMLYARNRETGNPAMKVVLLTATPVYDNPHEAALMINLLRPRISFPLQRKMFNSLFIDPDGNMKNKLLFNYMCSGYVSYFKGGNPNGYPYRTNYKKLHPMGSKQETMYTDTLVSEAKAVMRNLNNESDGGGGQYILSREMSNIAYPKGSDQEIENSLEDISNFSRELYKMKDRKKILKYTSEYSRKFVEIIKLVEKSDGPVFIYTSWVNHGILGIVSILNALGWDFINSNKSNNSPKYAIWSPSGLERLDNIYGNKKIAAREQDAYIKRMRSIFNSPENRDGSLCKVLIGSVVEGISLRRVKQVHVCEPWWNDSKMEQIIARAIRFCSHSDLPREEQYVDVYYHASTLSSYPGYNPTIQNMFSDNDIPITFRDLSRKGIEQSMYLTSLRKQKTNTEFELGLKESAIDCNINKYGNIIRLENYKIGNNNLYYNRSNGNYYIVEGNTLVGVNLQYNKLIKNGNLEYLVSNWPAVGYEKNGKNIPNVPIIRTEHDPESLDIILSENIDCNISNRDTSNLNFKELYEYAMNRGEEYNVWKYCYDMFRKTRLFPRLVIKYNLLSGGNGGKFSECLYKGLENPIENKLSSEDVKKMERFLLIPQAIAKNKEKYLKIVRKIPGWNNNNINKLNFVQLETLALGSRRSNKKKKKNPRKPKDKSRNSRRKSNKIKNKNPSIEPDWIGWMENNPPVNNNNYIGDMNTTQQDFDLWWEDTQNAKMQNEKY